jgi:hypothetical protein
MLQPVCDGKPRSCVRRNHPYQFSAAKRDEVPIPAVEFVNQASIGCPAVLSDFFSEDAVVQTVDLLELFRGLRLFEQDTGYYV